MARLDGKVAVILGAAGEGNMGQSIARRFAGEGARVIVAGRKEEPLRTLAQAFGGDHHICDITLRADVAALAHFAKERTGRLDIAVNCTGWAPMTKLLDVTEEELDKLTALQFKGVYFFLQSMVAQMAAGDALVRCFANEFGGKGVRVNSIAPGLTGSPMTEHEMALPGLQEAFIKEYPLGRIGTAADIANAALWLASDESFLTGQVLQINGGLTLRRNPTPKEINSSLRAAAAGNPKNRQL